MSPSRIRLLLVLILLAPAPALACGATEVCSDLESSLRGELVVDGLGLSWETDAEDATVGSYKVARWNGSIWVPQSLHFAVGSCATASYGAIDTGSAGGTYRVTVLDATQSLLCSSDVQI